MMNDKKRVYCLYRVSTKKQVEDNDIPMQKQRCREFAEQMGWEIIKEFSEKGVSGFKVSANDRDAIIEIKAAAEQHKFDILLVFMYDRLGRKLNETPFIVQWFVEQGIEVWSTVEGQQKFESDADELVNLLRFWQASGESKKTSVRTKTRMGQMVKEGKFKGGVSPYGYKLVKKGRKNRRDNEVYDIEIDEAEAEIVRLIFEKYVNEGYGNHRLSKYLTEHGIFNRQGKRFTNTTLNGMMKNIMYTGVLRSGDSYSEIFPHLQIITPEMFERAAKIRNDRTHWGTGTPISTKSNALLVGILYCASCGTKMILSSSGGNGRPVRYRYQCHHKVRHPDECDNQTTFTVQTLDEIVEKAVFVMFDNMRKVSSKKVIERRYEKETKLAKVIVDKLKKEVAAIQKDVDTYKSEVGKCLRGDSEWDADLLRELLDEAQTKLAAKYDELQKAQDRLDDCTQRRKEIQSQYDELVSWSQIYCSSSIEAKKMILSKLIERVEVGKGEEVSKYRVNIQFRISYAQFCGLADDDDTIKL